MQNYDEDARIFLALGHHDKHNRQKNGFMLSMLELFLVLVFFLHLEINRINLVGREKRI